MTDDTGQPTVDRLGALEAALRLMLTHGERCNWFADRGDEEVCDQARAALDAASPLTTSTPDKGALERARRLANRLAKHFIGEQFAAEDETCSRCVAMVTDALSAAASEARTAAIAQACRLCALEAVRANDRAVHAKPFSRETTDVWYATARELEDRIGALAAPAQSET